MLGNLSRGCRSGGWSFDISSENDHHPARRPTMNRVGRELEKGTGSDLARGIEPLATFICAADQPGAALMAAPAVLFHEVDRTFKAASAQIATFSGNPLS